MKNKINLLSVNGLFIVGPLKEWVLVPKINLCAKNNHELNGRLVASHPLLVLFWRRKHYFDVFIVTGSTCVLKV